MDCLSGYIGLKYCGGDTSPPSSLYINTLEGIQLDLLAKLAEGEQKGFLDVWNDIETRALMRLSDDVRAEFSKRYKLKNILSSLNLTRLVDSTTPIAASGEDWKGFTVDIRPAFDNTNYQFSPMAAINIQQLSFRVDTADAATVTDVKIFDLLTQEVLFTKSVTCVAGWNVVEVNEIFINDMSDRSRYIFCGVNRAALSSFTKTIDDLTYEPFIVNGATSNDGYTITQGTNTYGMTGIISQVCKFDAVVCQHKEIFKRALFYCLGFETMLETLSSTRMSKYTTIGTAKAEKNRDQYLLDYQKSLTQAVDGITISLSDLCIECNAKYQVKEARP